MNEKLGQSYKIGSAAKRLYAIEAKVRELIWEKLRPELSRVLSNAKVEPYFSFNDGKKRPVPPRGLADALVAVLCGFEPSSARAAAVGYLLTPGENPNGEGLALLVESVGGAQGALFEAVGELLKAYDDPRNLERVGVVLMARVRTAWVQEGLAKVKADAASVGGAV